MTQGGGSLLHKPFSKMQFLAVGSAVDSSNPLAMSGKAKMYSVDEEEEEKKKPAPHRNTMLNRQFTKNIDKNLRRISLF